MDSEYIVSLEKVDRKFFLPQKAQGCPLGGGGHLLSSRNLDKKLPIPIWSKGPPMKVISMTFTLLFHFLRCGHESIWCSRNFTIFSVFEI